MKVLKWEEFKLILTGYHLVNISLLLSFALTKITPICSWLYEECWFDTREHEILVFLGVIIVWKNRKSTNWLHYMSVVYMFSKIATLVLFFRANSLYGVIYGVLCLIGTLIFPEPAYKDSDKIVYFKGQQLLNELETNKHVHWIIEFYATWSPDCRHITPVFSKLSDRFTLPNLRFGKLDVGKEASVADRLRINIHPSSRQLPTIAYFRGTEQIMRRPLIGGNKRAIPFVFSEENCILEFGLNNIYEECKRSLGTKYQDSDSTKNKSE